jgi:hypothetical protein
MRSDYRRAISESREVLARRESALRGHAKQARVHLLRPLKDGTAPSLPRCAPLVGYRLRHVARWWACYRARGLAELLADKPRPGKATKLTGEAYEALAEQMRAGRGGTLKDARAYLAPERGITCGPVSGVW